MPDNKPEVTAVESARDEIESTVNTIIDKARALKHNVVLGTHSAHIAAHMYDLSVLMSDLNAVVAALRVALAREENDHE